MEGVVEPPPAEGVAGANGAENGAENGTIPAPAADGSPAASIPIATTAKPPAGSAGKSLASSAGSAGSTPPGAGASSVSPPEWGARRATPPDELVGGRDREAARLGRSGRSAGSAGTGAGSGGSSGGPGGVGSNEGMASYSASPDWGGGFLSAGHPIPGRERGNSSPPGANEQGRPETPNSLAFSLGHVFEEAPVWSESVGPWGGDDVFPDLLDIVLDEDTRARRDGLERVVRLLWNDASAPPPEEAEGGAEGSAEGGSGIVAVPPVPTLGASSPPRASSMSGGGGGGGLGLGLGPNSPESPSKRSAKKDLGSPSSSGSPRKEPCRLLRAHLRGVLRLSHTAPYSDVRSAFSALLEQLRGLPRLAIDVPERAHMISKFVLLHEIHEHGRRRDVLATLERIFLSTGRISNLVQMLGMHPEYLAKYDSNLNFVMRESGPLPSSWRCYIGMMAASSHRCVYLYELLRIEYSSSGGDLEWLNPNDEGKPGTTNAPKKLQTLTRLNSLLAHQPWLIGQEDIQLLVGSGSDSWSIAELVQALTIMCTFHASSSFCLGCGVGPELDFASSAFARAGMSNNGRDSEEDEDAVMFARDESTDDLVGLLRKATEDEEAADEEEEGALEAVAEAEAQRHSYFANAIEGADPGLASTVSDVVEGVDAPSHRSTWLHGNDPTVYHDFDVKSKLHPPLRMQDYNWQDHGFSLVGRYYSGAADLLDQGFRTAKDLTYSKLGDREEVVDTSPFRKAVWMYTHRLFGLFHDDYNYSETNIYLTKNVKSYIKSVSCLPETVTRSDFQNVGLRLQPDELVHINLLLLESRKQAEMLYGLRAVAAHMKLERSSES